MLRHIGSLLENEPARYAGSELFQPLAFLPPDRETKLACLPRLELVAQDNIAAAHGQLVKDVEPLGQCVSPITEPRLINDQENGIGSGPPFEDSSFAQDDVGWLNPGKRIVNRRWIHDEKFSIEIKNKTAAAVERTFVNDSASFAAPLVEKSGGICE